MRPLSVDIVCAVLVGLLLLLGVSAAGNWLAASPAAPAPAPAGPPLLPPTKVLPEPTIIPVLGPAASRVQPSLGPAVTKVRKPPPPPKPATVAQPSGGRTAPLFAQSPHGQLPVPTTYRYVSQWYGGQYPAHNGLDFAADYGRTVHAVAGGRVVGVWYWTTSYGLHVRIRHVNGYVTTYNHLSRIFVSPGQRIGRGAPIGAIGSTGHSTGNHLHFEIWHYGDTVNPAPWLW